MKRKTLTLTLCILSCLALIGVGFAAWVITPTTTDEQVGTIQVDTVTDNSLTVEYNWLDNKSTFVFGEGGTAAKEGDWLTVSADALVKDFDLTLVVTVTDKDGNPTEADVAASIEADANFKQLIPTYVTEPTAVVSTKDAEGKDLAKGTYHVNITIDWGTAFPEGPLAYYNGLEYSSENAKAAEDTLNAVNGLNGAGFTLTVVTKPITTTDAPAA